MFQTISFKSYTYMPLKSENVLILHCTARDAPNLFPPNINVLLISRGIIIGLKLRQRLLKE